MTSDEITVANSPSTMDAARQDPFFAGVKHELSRQLRLAPGMRVVEVGSGTGEDTVAMAAAVAPGGLAVGSDIAAHMIDASERRRSGSEAVFVRADAAALPLAADSVDAWRAERVLQHIPDVAGAIGEARRILRRGGRAAAAEPDWAGALLEPAAGCGPLIVRRWIGRSVQPMAGRALAGLLAQADFAVLHVELRGAVYRTFETASRFFPFAVAAAVAVEDGCVTAEEAAAWTADLERADAEGRFLFAVPLFLVAAEKT